VTHDAVRSLPVPFPDVALPAAEGHHASAPYWKGLREHRLLIQECEACGAARTPPSDLCCYCHSFDYRWREALARGTIFSWTRVWHPGNESAVQEVPYVIVWVVVDEESGSRVLGNLLGDAEDIRIGDPVKGVFQDRADGTVLNWISAGTPESPE
jgi:uncharacterized protein